MPEYPDVELYCERIRETVGGEVLEKVRVASPFVLRSVAPPLSSVVGARVADATRLGKRIVLHFDGTDVLLVIHLMIAGRLRWKAPGAALQRKVGLAAFDFPKGTLLFTEASTQKRASITLLADKAALSAVDPGGVEVFEKDEATFLAALRRENHTLKRSLTDPHVISGVGNAYSDEILHRAKLSPLLWTTKLSDEAGARLFAATRTVLREWTERLRAQTPGFPDKVTAFHDEMAVHGQFGKPCPVCGAAVQRIRRAANEVNYCPGCQTDGKLLADRGLSRLLKDDWPRSLDELDAHMQARRMPEAVVQAASTGAKPRAAAKKKPKK